MDHHGLDGLAFHIERFLADLLSALLQVGDGLRRRQGAQITVVDPVGFHPLCDAGQALLVIPDCADRAQNISLEGFYHASRLAGSAGEFSHFFPASG